MKLCVHLRALIDQFDPEGGLATFHFLLHLPDLKFVNLQVRLTHRYELIVQIWIENMPVQYVVAQITVMPVI